MIEAETVRLCLELIERLAERYAAVVVPADPHVLAHLDALLDAPDAERLCDGGPRPDLH